MKGRKPTPRNLRLLRGNPGNHHINENEPQPDIVIPEPPEHLGDIAKAEWNRLSEELYRLGLISELDRSALAAYCQVYARWVEAEDTLKRMSTPQNPGGLLLKTSNGNIIQNPLVGASNKALQMMHKFLTEFGMTPSSRSRVSATPPKGKDKKAGWGSI